MAEDAGGGEKTEEPSARKLSEARRKGSVAKSSDLNSSLIILFGTILIWMWGKRIGGTLESILRECLLAIPNFAGIPEGFQYYAVRAYLLLLGLLAPVFGTLMVLGVMMNIMQFGFLWTFEPMGFKFGKIFKLQGLKKILSPQSLLELLKNVAKIAIVGFVAYQVISSHYEEYLLLADKAVPQIVSLLFSVSLELLFKCALLLVILGLCDLTYQKWKFRKDMKMSKQEVKDEARAAEGDPKIKGKIKSLRLQMHRSFMMKELPKATVVITNPTFIAVAVRYEQEVDEAPVIVAKGKRLIAEKIRDSAKAHDIPIVEDKPLARSLYDTVEVGEAIPREFFAAVAEILAYVYGLKRQGAA